MPTAVQASTSSNLPTRPPSFRPSAPPSQSSRRPPAIVGPSSAADEFGSLPPQPTRAKSYAPPMPVPLPAPAPSFTNTLHASSVTHTAQSTQAQSSAAAQRKRQSHNPSSTLQNPSPPKQEYLSDEWVLHPSVYAYRQQHPRRPMVGFGPYVLLHTLGEGEFGKVKLGVHTEFGVEVAIKLIRRGSLDDEVRAGKVEREIDVLKTLRHPNIVRMFDVIDTEKYIGIVLEFAGGGELFDHILANRYLKEKDAQKLFAQLISGVDYLHKKHIVHRDLKLENLLLDKHRNIIITDFGFANRFNHSSDDLMATSCGSPCYAAPELVVSEGLYVGSAVDIWSCGVILYAMLSGYLPYDDDPNNPEGDNINLLYKYIMTTKLNFPDHISPLARHLLQMMLVPNPEHRCTVQEIMVHPWLSAHADELGKTVEEQETIFQENMHKKSQAAKRELNQRQSLQRDAKQARTALMRSHSSAPGTGVTASALDERRRQRPYTAMAGASTIPLHLDNAGRTPPLMAIAAEASAFIVNAPSSVTTHGTVPMPSVSMTPSAIAASFPVDPRTRSQSMAPALVQTHSDRTTISSKAVENESARVSPALEAQVIPPQAPEMVDEKSKVPMSANINRHTIQVEYDLDASYERVNEAMDARKTHSVEDARPTPILGVSDVDMASSSEHVSPSAEGMETLETISSSERPTPKASQQLPPLGTSVPVIIEEVKESSAPSTPTRSKISRETEGLASPTTPRAPLAVRTDIDATPRASKPLSAVETTPKRKEPTVEPIKKPALTPAGLPKPPTQSAQSKRRSKGMSLDKFGFSRLLGQVADEPKTAPPTSGRAAAAIQRNQTASSASKQQTPTGGVARPRPAEPEKDKDKKTRRRTLQLMVNRAASPREGKSTTAPAPTPLSPRDTNATPSAPSAPSATPAQSPPMVITGQGIHPGSHDREQSSASLVTVDVVTPPPGAQKGASSNAAKKVMDWFRRKSLAKDTLSGFKGVKDDVEVDGEVDGDGESTGSFVRVSDGRGRPRIDTVAAAMSSTSSIAHTAESAPPLVADVPEPVPDSATLPKSALSPSTQPERMPLSQADNKTNIPTTTTSLLPPVIIPSPLSPKARSTLPTPTSQTPSQALSSAHGSTMPHATLGQTKGTSSHRTYDDSKMSVHHGVVDQSTLSSRPPKEVMQEVINVLLEMGIDVKRENEFKLRCVRVRRRKAGPSTGLGLGSVMSVTGGRGFTLMGNASTNKTDSRGLPLPTSSSVSSGLKGMLLRRGSSYSSHVANLNRAESNVLSSPSLTSLAAITNTKEPLYGEHSVDSGDEVKFHVELCRIKNLPGLYSLTIKRIKGSVWSFKFIYQTVVE
ncbi:CAMK/CAMKL/KIN4 protein kinase [Tremella mesenterica]|uniref:non-specific serine/threonine protein kinase n=1 Tax=Tremella mesenterica TaxID=5217 RepID=A0A4Q1BLY4_TREME|nr:CAMK/CAMKL/KIN4 protein kinase [Tremella mesenterica]